MTDSLLRVGLIGTGRIGQIHGRHIGNHADSVLARIADPYIEGARQLAKGFGSEVTDDPRELIDSGDLDAVVVAAPTPQHVNLIEACVDAGVPVLCEKPIDLDLTRVDGLAAKVAASGVPVAIGFNQRFDPAIAEVHERVANGAIGQLEQLVLVSRDPGPPPADYLAVSGGIFRDMTIHDFDLARFFVGEVVEVSAFGSALFDAGAQQHDDFDTVNVTLRGASGALVSIVNSRHSAYGYDQRLEAFGSEGLLQVANAPASLVHAASAEGVETKAPYVESFLDRYETAYARELTEFYRLVRREAATSPTFQDGQAAQVIADAAHRSAHERRTVRLDS
ncbi:inositol 2-dehydrogenase [Gulosibacter sp. ACHW.36C]|uniref:Inositol 2-dehydrogenase n=1 Tax=Gulosibacter sediminis TaxID=1729695 RepID=A0ABY4MXA7_9MICO|nr:inositol 2-dehydrogenase [Gulosibacter sediminis]UQN15061.1 inositol 2-dehydrogenase [Gulosibacter sediminis]